MKIGFGLPVFGRMGTRANIRTLAQEAETLGYDSLWAGERLLYPTQPKNLQGVTEVFFSSTQGGAGEPDALKQQLDQLSRLRGVA